MQITPGRVVAFFTPVFAAGSAALTPWLVKYTGLHINPTEVTTLAVAGATSATAAGIKFLHGSSLYERDLLHVESYATRAAAVLGEIDPTLVPKAEAAAEQAGQDAVAKVAEVIDGRPGAFPPAPEVPAAPAPAPVVEHAAGDPAPVA
jgi:hypothetical protein